MVGDSDFFGVAVGVVSGFFIFVWIVGLFYLRYVVYEALTEPQFFWVVGWKFGLILIIGGFLSVFLPPKSRNHLDDLTQLMEEGTW